MKNYTNFLSEKINDKQQSFLNVIILHLFKNLDYNLFEYNNPFIIRKKRNTLNLIGKLYLSDTGKAVRFNFNNRNIYSIDLWEDFIFNKKKLTYNNPTYTMIVNNSILSYLDDVIDFLNGDFELNENNDNVKEIYVSGDEHTVLEGIKIPKAVLEEKFDIFELMKMYVRQVAAGLSNSLVITGGPGLGKTHDVEETLNEMRSNYVMFGGGDVTKAGLYEILFLNRDKLIVFDDMDSVLDGKDNINMLKKVLDTYKNREVSRLLKTNFDSAGMSDDEIEKTYRETGRLPNKFIFSGRIIFITNMNAKKLDTALISRSLHVDIDLTRQEVLDRLRKIMNNLYTDINEKIKEEALLFLDYIVLNYNTKFRLDIRTLIHTINIRISNDFKITSPSGESVPAWQVLVKQYLIDIEPTKNR